MAKIIQKIVRGWTFRYPSGNLDWRLAGAVETAQSNAAFSSEREHSHIELPKDWDRAYEQGFRVVRCVLVADGKAVRRAKKYRKPKK